MALNRIPNMKNILKGGVMALVMATFVFALFTGCSSEKKEAPKAKATAEEQVASQVSTESVARGSSMPSDHPAFDKTADAITKASHANIKTKKELDISDEVRATWKEVQIEITDNAAKLTKVVTLKVGTSVQLTDEGHYLKIEVVVPDYAISENKIQSRSNEPNNPAVLVDLLEKDKTVARGWVFKEFPEFNSFNDPRFHLVLVAPGAEKKAQGKQGK